MPWGLEFPKDPDIGNKAVATFDIAVAYDGGGPNARKVTISVPRVIIVDPVIPTRFSPLSSMGIVLSSFLNT